MTPASFSPVSGILILNKSEGMTSQAAVTRVKRLFGAAKAGHTGTLDPLATGVLPILLGRASKASDLLLTEDKHYQATLLLGQTSDTEDVTGVPLSTYHGEMPDEATVRRAVETFIGEGEQIPPMYSALKVGGKKLYELAREGKVIERTPRKITIFSVDVTRMDERRYRLDVHCSKGTYIRTLCADIGRKLGVGGVMASLCRTEAAGFSLKEAVTLEELEAKTAGEREATLYPISYLFRKDRRADLPPFFARLARAGQEIYLSKIGLCADEGERIALYDNGEFFAIGEVRIFPNGKAVKPTIQFVI